jgi:hypothetical protein
MRKSMRRGGYIIHKILGPKIMCDAHKWDLEWKTQICTQVAKTCWNGREGPNGSMDHISNNVSICVNLEIGVPFVWTRFDTS